MKHAAKSETKEGATDRDQSHRHLAGAITIKATIAEAQIDGVLHRYGLTAEREAPHHIYFFDTPDLTLLKAGISARARRICGDDHDSTLVFHPVVPGDVPARWRECDGYQLEIDAGETGMATSATFTIPVRKGMIKQVVAGEKGVAKLFSREQEAFLAAVGGHAIEYQSLCVLGPIEGHRWTFYDPACPWHMTAALWQREDGARLMELAIKVPLVQVDAATAGFSAFLRALGVERNITHQTKARWVLGH